MVKVFEEQEKQEAAAAFRRFGATASAHGIKSAIASKGPIRVFWIIVFLTALAWCIFQLYNMINRYYNYETTTSVRLVFESLKFPAVTVCSMNPYLKSAVENVTELQDLMNSYESALAELSEQETL